MTIDNSARLERMHQLLSDALSPTALEIIDDSHKHVGHAGAASGAGHFTVKIIADAFSGKLPLQCHRLVYAALDEMMPEHIHALSIQATAPDRH